MTEEELTVRELMRCSSNPAKEIAKHIIETNNYTKKVWYVITSLITISLTSIILILYFK